MFKVIENPDYALLDNFFAETAASDETCAFVKEMAKLSAAKKSLYQAFKTALAATSDDAIEDALDALDDAATNLADGRVTLRSMVAGVEYAELH